MGNKVFVPITDEILYDHPELISSQLLPYMVDRDCFHWSAEIENEDDSSRVVMMREFMTRLSELPIASGEYMSQKKVRVA